MATGKTSLSVSVKTRDRLAARGKKDDTFDEIIGRLLDEVKDGNSTEATCGLSQKDRAS